MKIRFHADTVKPMTEWLLNRKKYGISDERRLREILTMPDYQVEFARYGVPGLPVCGISYEEAVDFFMNFDRKDFENPRLQNKKESFLKFYSHMEDRLKMIDRFSSLTQEDCDLIEKLLANGLTKDCLKETPELGIILIISIGNSMGWPYDRWIDYDAANLDLFESKEDFLHVTAHEIHHLFIGPYLFPEGIRGEDYFLQSFAFEGLAVHYNNNLATRGKPKKYDDVTYGMQKEDMEFYETHFDEIFDMIRSDYRSLMDKTPEEANAVVSSRYEQFEFLGKKVRQYPTYYFGCYMWGLVDLKYGKDKVFDAILDPKLFVKLYTQAAEEKYQLCDQRSEEYA